MRSNMSVILYYFEIDYEENDYLRTGKKKEKLSMLEY
jgi:hypothetical protein